MRGRGHPQPGAGKRVTSLLPELELALSSPFPHHGTGGGKSNPLSPIRIPHIPAVEQGAEWGSDGRLGRCLGGTWAGQGSPMARRGMVAAGERDTEDDTRGTAAAAQQGAVHAGYVTAVAQAALLLGSLVWGWHITAVRGLRASAKGEGRRRQGPRIGLAGKCSFPLQHLRSGLRPPSPLR